MGEVMPLTPEDVSNKRFTPVRLREGYDMGEVDQFLDEVEAELARLTKENDDLRSKLSAASRAAPPPTSAAPEPEPDVEATPEPEPEPEPEPAPAPAPVGRRRPVETIRVETVPEASNAAARLLEIATRNADELVDEAKNEADKIIGEARTKAERLESESKAKADRLEADARTRAQMLDSETAERRQQMFGDLEKERDKLNARGREPALVRARVPLPPEELLQPAARGAQRLRRDRRAVRRRAARAEAAALDPRRGRRLSGSPALQPRMDSTTADPLGSAVVGLWRACLMPSAGRRYPPCHDTWTARFPLGLQRRHPRPRKAGTRWLAPAPGRPR